jgi:hypothetical protein
MYVYECIHTLTHSLAHTHRVCVYACVCLRVYTHTLSHTHTHAHTHSLSHTHRVYAWFTEKRSKTSQGGTAAGSAHESSPMGKHLSATATTAPRRPALSATRELAPFTSGHRPSTAPAMGGAHAPAEQRGDQEAAATPGVTPDDPVYVPIGSGLGASGMSVKVCHSRTRTRIQKSLYYKSHYRATSRNSTHELVHELVLQKSLNYKSHYRASASRSAILKSTLCGAFIWIRVFLMCS